MKLSVNNIEKCNKPRHFKPLLFQKMQESLRDSIDFDFNTLIEDYSFYQRLPPSF